jgi:hypothetical protein
MMHDGGDCSIAICKWVGGWWCSAGASVSESMSMGEGVSVSVRVGMSEGECGARVSVGQG